MAGQPETAETIISRIDEATDTLAGVDRARPGGVAIYLDSVFPPAFEFVAFVPLTDTGEFLRTLELGPVVASPVAGEEGRFELLGPSRTSQVRIEYGYAFIQLPVMAPDEAFDRPLFDPVTVLAAQTSQFDLAVTLDVDAVPPATRSLLTSFLTATLSTQMQQRDDEPDGVYEMRRAWMQGDIDGLKLLIEECRELTIGISVDSEQRLANIDFLIDVRDGSDLLLEILEATTKPSYFAPILDDNSAVSLSLSQVLPQRDRERYIGVLDGLRTELARQTAANGTDAHPDETSPVNAALSALQDTAEEGHLDVFGQCYSDQSGHLIVVGAMRVLDGEVIASGLSQLLSQLQEQDGLENLQIGMNEHAGIQFHRVGFDSGNPGWNAILGPDSGLVFGCGPRSVWFGLGGSETMQTVSDVMDQLQTAYDQPAERSHSSGMRVVVNVQQLIRLSETAGAANRAAGEISEEPDSQQDEARKPALTRRQQRRERFRKGRAARLSAWKETFAEGGDRVRIDVQPAQHGSRTRIELGEAFLKGLVRAISVSIGPSGSD